MPPFTKAIRLFLIVLMFGLIGSAIPDRTVQGQSTSVTLNATADAQVDRSNPNTNYGTKTYLTVDGSPILRSYIRFNVSGLNGARISGARLRLYTLYASSKGFSVVKAGNSWTETSITYNTAPTLGSTIRTVGSFKANSWIEVDVTGSVTGEGDVTYVLNSSSGDAFTIASRERNNNTYIPMLMLTLDSSAPANPPTAAPTATAVPTKVPTLAPTLAPTAVPTKAPTIAPTATPSGQPMPVGVPGNWSLKFADDFNGTQLDLNKWEPNWLAGNDTAITKPINRYENSCYDPKQVSVVNGNLKLSAVARSCTDNRGTTYPYASGIVTSRPHYTFTYGYMEARVWLDGSSAIKNWPAFWANGTGPWPTTGEIDVFEGYGGTASWHYHWGTSTSPQEVGSHPPMNPQTGWHIFAADWQPGSITYYYDGKEVGKVTSNVVNSQMFLILNYGVSSQIASPIQVPSDFLVDYVRVWQRQ